MGLVGQFLLDTISRKGAPTHFSHIPHICYASRAGDRPGNTTLCSSQEQSKAQAPAFVQNKQHFQDGQIFPGRAKLSNTMARVESTIESKGSLPFIA